MIYISKQKLDDTTAGSTCRGFDLSIMIDDIVFKIRNHVDRLDEFAVISPKTARQSPQARQLVDYLTLVLGGKRMFFYDGRSDLYREVDLQTLEFEAHKNNSVQRRPKASADHICNSASASLRLIPA
jgi:hypothetical protein